MTMLSELKFTDARKEFSTLYDEVYIGGKPVIVKRKQKEQVILLNADLQKMLLSAYSLKPEVESEEDGSVTLSLDSLEIYVNDESLEKAVYQLIQDLKMYASDYIQRSQLFLNAPNRRSHFPYILRILLCENDEEIRGMLEL